MWIPAWLGECYSKLYVKFGREVFRFSEAEASLSVDRNKLSVAFSKLTLQENSTNLPSREAKAIQASKSRELHLPGLGNS